MARHRRSRRLSELPAVAGHPDGGVGQSGAAEVGIDVLIASAQRGASGGAVFGAWRGATARSYAYATLSSVGSLHGCPRRSMPTGSPSGVNPAGILIAGNPVVALSWQFEPPCG